MTRDPASRETRAARQEALLQLLRAVRRETGLRQTELAKRLGKPQFFVSKYETGERRLDLLELEQVCEAMGVEMTEFVRRFEESGAERGKT